jgi:hypothetical protein
MMFKIRKREKTGTRGIKGGKREERKTLEVMRNGENREERKTKMVKRNG